MKRSLTLKREALSPLTADDLAEVAGGQYSAPGAISCAVTECLQLVTTDQVITIVSRQITCYACVSLTAC